MNGSLVTIIFNQPLKPCRRISHIPPATSFPSSRRSHRSTTPMIVYIVLIPINGSRLMKLFLWVIGGEMSSGTIFNNKSSSGSGNPFGLSWNQFQSGELVPKIGSFGSGNFSEMVNPFVPNSSPNSGEKRRGEFNPNMKKRNYLARNTESEQEMQVYMDSQEVLRRNHIDSVTPSSKISHVVSCFLNFCDKNEQLHVFDPEETLEDAEKSQLKMNEFKKDEKIQELKIQPIDYEKLNKLYKDFVPQKERSAEQTYFSSSCISSVSKTSSEKMLQKTKP
ncbi:hypothetical protein Tco_1502393 [Tanacetum coccineum]